MRIGNTELKYGIMLAPMAGFSDRAMRRICHDFGAEYSVCEMVSAKAVAYKDKKSRKLAKIMADEGPCAVQIFGSEPQIMAYAAEALSHGEEGGVPPVAIDINMGCPVPKVFSNGEGSALMKNPELIYKITKACCAAVQIPVTVKMRSGIDEGSINAVECAIAAEEGGASLVAVHGRTRVQMYAGEPNMEIIKNVKKALHIPVIANGNATSAQTARAMLEYTGADGIMIGRGAIGNPFLFSEIAADFSGIRIPTFTLEERVEAALLQLSVAIEEKGEESAVLEARKQIAMYLRAFSGAAAIRARINQAKTYLEVEGAMRSALTT